MHRHQYSGRKLSRTRDQRRALLRSMATSLVMQEQITTTKPKAKELVRYTEPLITKAKQGSLHARRQLQGKVSTEAAIQKLMDDLAPRFTKRPGGYIRLQEAGFRMGDDARLATLSFTEKPLPKPKKAETSQAKKPAKAKPKVAKSAAKSIAGSKK